MKTFKIEKDVKREVKRLLDKHKWFWWCPPANAFGKSGISDFHTLRSGVFMAIETKFGTNKTTAQQIGFMNSIRTENSFAFVVSDRTIEWFEQWLDAFDRACAATQRQQDVDPVDGSLMLNAVKVMTEMLGGPEMQNG